VTGRIETRICTQNSLELADITEKIDFAFAIAVARDIPDVSGFFSEIHDTLKPGHKFPVVEPKGHISAEKLENCFHCRPLYMPSTLFMVKSQAFH